MREHRYRLVVRGTLTDEAAEGFSGLDVETDGEQTSLSASMDQAALFGVIRRVQQSGLELLEIYRDDPPDG